MHEPLTNLRRILFLQFDYGTPRAEIWRGLNGAATLQAQCGKIVIAVSDDIDPENTDAVFWSMAYRTNPVDDLEIMTGRSAGHGPKSSAVTTDSGILIDATRKTPMPPLALPTKPYMDGAREIWEELGLSPLTVKTPWHGYSLGDWDNSWEEFAQNTVNGQWLENGRATFDRRRPGIRPETPVRQVEADDDKAAEIDGEKP